MEKMGNGKQEDEAPDTPTKKTWAMEIRIDGSK